MNAGRAQQLVAVLAANPRRLTARILFQMPCVNRRKSVTEKVAKANAKASGVHRTVARHFVP